MPVFAVGRSGSPSMICPHRADALAQIGATDSGSGADGWDIVSDVVCGASGAEAPSGFSIDTELVGSAIIGAGREAASAGRVNSVHLVLSNHLRSGCPSGSLYQPAGGSGGGLSAIDRDYDPPI